MISWRKHYKKGLIAIGLLLSTGASVYAQGDPKKGQELFKANCTACHALDKKVVGPALGGVVEKVKKDGQDVDWLHKWISNNEKLRASGDAYANKIYEENGKVAMQVFEGKLSDQDIDDILEYTTNPPKEEPAAEAEGATAVDTTASIEAAKAQQLNSKIMIAALIAIAGLLFWLLLKIRQLVKIQQSPELSELNSTRVVSFSALYEKYSFVGKGIVGLLALFAAYGVWNWLMWVGVYKGYAPEQPIYFSHKIHAGENKIDCQLCHSGAKYGKVSEIPSLNVCMNCHRSISEYKGKYIEPGKDREFYTSQIKTLYAHVGWDESKQAYTGKTEPVEWTRIHNMPDFVYFNHSQHVVAGEQAIINSFNAKQKDASNKIDVVCKACHGKIDTMNVVQMANNFTMGWCIDCHRTTEVDMNNGYNKEYFKNLHDKLKKQYGEGSKITVDAIGGLECGKCHY